MMKFPPKGNIETVWTPADAEKARADFEAHAAEAIAVVRQTTEQLCPVIDLFTKRRLA